jgi:ERCC4-type nuclease
MDFGAIWGDFMNILVDNREKPDIINQGRKLFPNLKVTTLLTGDVLCGNILIERKQIKDFELSIKDKRYVNQSINMIEAIDKGAHPYILIEGHFDELERNGYSKITRKAYRGAIATLTERYGLNVIEVDDNEDFWLQVDRLIVKYNDKRPIKRVYVTPTAPTTDERMLLGLHGLGEVRAENILEKFSLHELFHCSVEDLMTVEGIGAKYATRIVNELQGGAVE